MDEMRPVVGHSSQAALESAFWRECTHCNYRERGRPYLPSRTPYNTGNYRSARTPKVVINEIFIGFADASRSWRRVFLVGVLGAHVRVQTLDLDWARPQASDGNLYVACGLAVQRPAHPDRRWAR